MRSNRTFVLFLWLSVLYSCSSIKNFSEPQTVSPPPVQQPTASVTKTLADRIQRKPYVAIFQLQGWNDPVMFVGAHARPDAAIDEAEALVEIDVELRDKNTIKNSIVLGDLNLACKYASAKQLRKLNFRKMRQYKWLTDDASDSSSSEKESCAYDRIIVNGPIEKDAKNSRVLNDIPKISDHFPIAAEILKLTIGTFNLQRYGNTKASSETYLKQLGEVICRFDLILLVELVGKDEGPFAKIVPAAKEVCKRDFKIAYSDLTGSDTYMERFAYVYDHSKVTLQHSFLVK